MLTAKAHTLPQDLWPSINDSFPGGLDTGAGNICIKVGGGGLLNLQIPSEWHLHSSSCFLILRFFPPSHTIADPPASSDELISKIDPESAHLESRQWLPFCPVAPLVQATTIFPLE